MARKTIYLDYAAATPVEAAVLATMRPYFSGQFYNPSATYQAARLAGEALNQARSRVAHWLGARPSEVIFTAGGTEANNLAIHGITQQFLKGNVVVSSVEHESVLAPAGRYERRLIEVDACGRLDLDDLRARIDDNTVLVSVMYANNEVGTIQPIREVARIVNESHQQRSGERPLYLHTDACQAGNYLDLHVARLGVDLMTINGGKIYGPKQSGALYVKGGISLQPLIDGGGQERGLRSGTENVAGAVGLAAALDLVQTDRHQEVKRLQQLQARFMGQIAEKLPTAIINGSQKWRLPNNVHVTLPGRDNERLIFELDEAGIMAAAGSACSASNEEPSHVLRAMGISRQDAQASLRFTLGRNSDEAEVAAVLDKLVNLAS